MALLIEHLNLNVTDRDLAQAFYVDGLRCQLNPKGTNHRQLHVNLGLSQFHLPFKQSVTDLSPVRVPQVLPGRIGLLTCESLDALQARLQSLRQLEDVIKVHRDSASLLNVKGPFGNHFVISKCDETRAEIIKGQGGHVGGTDMMVSLAFVHIFCPVGSTGMISGFYQEILGCSVQAGRGGATSVVVPFALGQCLIFEESREHPCPVPHDVLPGCGYHIAIYLASEEAFDDAFRRAEQQELVFINPRFEGGPIEFASAKTLPEAQEAHQFRLKNIPKMGANMFDTAFQLEHEVRGPGHICFPVKAPGFSSSS